MNEKTLKKRLDLQQKTISRQLEQIESLKLQNEKLKLKCEEKDEIINSIIPLKDKLTKSLETSKGYEVEYKKLINELRKMKDTFNQIAFKGRWTLVKLLIK